MKNMKKSKSILISRILNRIFSKALIPLSIIFLIPLNSYGKIYIDISSPSQKKIKIAVPDFKNYNKNKESPELAEKLAGVISNDLDLSGYFLPMDKNSFLDEDGPKITPDNINFKNWSLIGADLLIKGAYTCIGSNLEVSIRLYDPFQGRQIFGKRYLGETDEYRHLMHRIGNDVILSLTGNKGVFLSRFLFVNNSTGHREVYICDFDGKNIKRLTFDKSIALLPRWSPTGKGFVYNSYKEGGGPMLYYEDLQSGKIRKVSGRPGLNTGACWSRDGKSLDLTLSNGENSDIYKIDLNGKILKRLTNHWGINTSPSISPDGTKMAFVSDRSGRPQIYIKDLKNGNDERITFDLKYCTSPVWSSLNKIAFSVMDGGGHNIYTINPDGSGLKQLTKNSGNNESPCWSPGGRYIVFSSSRSGGFHLYLMNANGNNQRRITYFKGEELDPSWSPF